MKSTPTKATLALFTLTALAAIAATEQSPRAVLGKIDFQALYAAAPSVPATAPEAAKRAYGAVVEEHSDTAALDKFYAPFQMQVVAARNKIQGALDSQSTRSEARGKRAMAHANANPLISRMGGVEKMGEMSEAEMQQSMSQAMGDTAQSMSGAPPGVNVGGGMQAVMQQMMSDPALQARFEKMPRAEQEAYMQKMMGNAHAPPPPTGPTAAEQQAKKNTDESADALAWQKGLDAIMQRINGIAAIDTEFDKKDKAIQSAPGSHKDIDAAFQAKFDKLPRPNCGEAGCFPDAAKAQVLAQERVTRNRARATSELSQRAALYLQRVAKYNEIAASYAAWFKQDPGPRRSTVAQQLDEGTVDGALRAESDLIGFSERLAKYTEAVTSDAAGYEKEYKHTMSLPPGTYEF